MKFLGRDPCSGNCVVGESDQRRGKCDLRISMKKAAAA